MDNEFDLNSVDILMYYAIDSASNTYDDACDSLNSPESETKPIEVIWNRNLV